jgi:uncharacterized LabA/DUF88 family protein
MGTTKARMQKMKRTTVYIDGFNFYYGVAKRWGCKWIDFRSMVQSLLPHNTVDTVKLYTALVSPTKHSPWAHTEQAAYHRALELHSGVEITLGHFLTHTQSVRRIDGSNERVLIRRTEEKGTDVNLAVGMVHDAYRDMFEVGVLISNDSDFLRAIQVVQGDLDKVIGIVNPQKHRQSVELAKHANFVKTIR